MNPQFGFGVPIVEKTRRVDKFSDKISTLVYRVVTTQYDVTYIYTAAKVTYYTDCEEFLVLLSVAGRAV